MRAGQFRQLLHCFRHYCGRPANEMFPDRPWGPAIIPRPRYGSIWAHSEFEIDKSIGAKLQITVAQML